MTEEPERSGPIAAMRAHPIITSIMFGCMLIGVGLALTFLPVEWALARRIAAGAVAGAGVGLTITATKMIG